MNAAAFATLAASCRVNFLSRLIISAWPSATTPASGASVWHKATVAARSADSNRRAVAVVVIIS